jgi:restriction endonuclease S subunit
MAEGSNQPNISPTRLENFKIPVPKNTDEQSEIAEVFTALNNKSVSARRKISLLIELNHNLLHRLMNAQVRVSEIKFPDTESITIA